MSEINGNKLGINIPIRIGELFAGYGGASFALKRAGIKYETAFYSEIDKYAIKCYEQNHNGNNYGDCTKININDLPDFDLLTGGFPCQAFSVAGKMQGEADVRGTLFYEIIRIAEAKKPKYMLLENVKGLTCNKFKDTFSKILSELDRIGYNVYWKVLNSKDYGIPQSRQRVWFVCFRKDIDTKEFAFPEPEELKILGKDILEKEVEDKYYLTEKMQERFRLFMEEKGIKINELKDEIFDIGRKEYRINKEQIVPTLKMKMGTGGNNVPIIVDTRQSDTRIYENVFPTLRGERQGINVIGNNQQDYIFATITTENAHLFGKNVTIRQSETIYQLTGLLRRLTPKECFRLMGFLNDEIKLDGLSDTQRYKLAGNGWEIHLASKILKAMLV